MIRRRPRPPSFQTNINLTSMSDLTFLLLIAFIITFPIIEQGIPIRLPKGTSQQVDAQKQIVSVSIDREGRIYLGTDAVQLEQLRTGLQARLAENPELRLVIRGDESSRYGIVAQVARLANELNITRMSLATNGDGSNAALD
ncbi:MAG: ExbD/TolR family protein [Kiritimatiellia bacterium]